MLQFPRTENKKKVRGANSGRNSRFCSCDGKYFLLMRGAASPAQMCEAFCPASSTEVFLQLQHRQSLYRNRQTLADSENAVAYRKRCAPIAPATAHNPAGLASVDLAMDGSLPSGDALAAADGLVGNDQNSDFVGLLWATPEVRARLNDPTITCFFR